MKAEVYWIPGPWSGRLAILPRPRGGDWLSDEVRSWREAGVDVVTSLLTPEEALELELRDEEARCREQGLEFRSFPIPDRGVPQSRAGMLDLMVALRRALESGRNVGVHCRQGIGRSGLLAASLLVTAGDDAERAFRTIERIRGTPVPETAAQQEWVRGIALREPAAAV
jgi:protein-tyrosine phosphatase